MPFEKCRILLISRKGKLPGIFKKIKYVEWIQKYDLTDNKRERNICGIIIILDSKSLKKLKKIFATYPNIPKYGIIPRNLKGLKPSLLRMGFSGIEELPIEIEKVKRMVTSLIWGERYRGDTVFNIFIREMLAHAVNTRSEKAVINRITESILHIFRADRVSIMHLDPNTNSLTIKSAVGIPGRVFKSGRKKLGEKIAGWVAQKNLPILLQDGLIRDERFMDIKGNPNIKSSIIVPLTFADATVGVINITRFKGDKFTEEDRDRAALYSSFIAMLMHQLKELDRIELLNRAVNNAREGIVIIDREGRILMLSRGAESMLGIHLNEVIDKYFHEAVNLQIDKYEMERIIRGGSITNLQINYTGPDDIQRILLLSASPVIAPDRRRSGAIIILRELTDFVELYRDKLKVEKLHELTRWIDEISHRMNNPLSVIMGNIHLINDSMKVLPEIKDKVEVSRYYERLFPELKKMLSEINDASERLNLFIKTMRNFEIEEEIHWERCFFADLVDRAVDIAEIENIHNIKIVKRYAYNPIILCVRDKLISALVILIKNAIAQSRGKEKIEIILKKSHEGVLFEMDCACLEQVYTGKQKEEPMSAFYSMLDIPAGFQKGYGLVSFVVNLHHGRIGFELKDEKKLSVKLTLPEHKY